MVLKSERQEGPHLPQGKGLEGLEADGKGLGVKVEEEGNNRQEPCKSAA